MIDTKYAYTEDLLYIGKSLKNNWDITDFEALSIAVKMQNNMIWEEALMTGRATPNALEAIVMAMRDRNNIEMSKGEYNANSN